MLRSQFTVADGDINPTITRTGRIDDGTWQIALCDPTGRLDVWAFWSVAEVRRIAAKLLEVADDLEAREGPVRVAEARRQTEAERMQVRAGIVGPQTGNAA